jgi:uncharacterized LabA/DUF88 family protein
MPAERVVTFIDGFNLCHAVDNLRRPHLKWLNLWALSEVFLRRRSQQLRAVYYFSAFAEWLPDKAKRHQEYVKALIAIGVTPVIAKFKHKDRRCPSCNHSWTGHEEKETDVNIALALMHGAYRDEYDHAFLISRDSDLAPAVRKVGAEFPQKRITIIAPPNRGHSTELLSAVPPHSRHE